MLASLPMYDLPEIRAATDGFWDSVATAYGTKIRLTRSANWSAPWHNPNLLFSQTCGYPFTHEFAGKLTYVATPCYDADGCDGANYCSIIFAREAQPITELRHKIAAINSPDSMSGMLALKLVLEVQNFTHHIETGSHLASLRAVQSSQADVCAIDCVTVALLRKYRPEALLGLVEIGRSPAVPGLPYVTRCGDVERLNQALTSASKTSHAKALLIKSITVLSVDAYNQILKLEASLNTRGRNRN
jgi:ABC-type phosphate/phosphonate transport system substrate-binding protein